MKLILCRDITRRTPFELEHLPWILKCYRYPFDRWTTVGRQGLFGAPNLLAFYVYKNLLPFNFPGSCSLTVNGQKKPIRFNSKNATFGILYFKLHAMGYEPQISALFDLIIPAKGVFYDIGSNWGWFSMMTASRPGFEGQVHAFEPFPSTYSDLTSMVEQAGLTSRIQCHNLALMDEAGTASIYIPDFIHSGCATVTKENKGHTGIKTSTLDAFNAPPPDVMKVDVEGNESKVFIGGKKTLEQHKPMVVFENKRDTDELDRIMEPISLLEKLGYVFYHAAWLRKLTDGPCLVGDQFDPHPQRQETLALVPFQSAQRLLLHDAMNILACHRDKVALLESNFEKREI